MIYEWTVEGGVVNSDTHADRVDRKTMLVAADLVRVGLLRAFPFVTTWGRSTG